MASRRFGIVKGPSKFTLMVSQYTRDPMYRSRTTIEFQLDDKTLCSVEIHAMEHSDQSRSEVWDFIGEHHQEGVVRGSYSTASGTGWIQFIGFPLRRLLSLYEDCDASLDAPRPEELSSQMEPDEPGGDRD